MIQTGKPAEVTLEEYPEISRTWTRRVAVELPAGFEAAEAGDGRKHIFRGSDCYELTANADGVPCIIDHTQRGGPFIPLPILSEAGASNNIITACPGLPGRAFCALLIIQRWQICLLILPASFPPLVRRPAQLHPCTRKTPLEPP